MSKIDEIVERYIDRRSPQQQARDLALENIKRQLASAERERELLNNSSQLVGRNLDAAITRADARVAEFKQQLAELDPLSAEHGAAWQKAVDEANAFNARKAAQKERSKRQ
jgi:hypothetical protein